VNWLFSVALHNAALMMLLAPLVWAVARMCRKPPVAHLLWLLVLAKLLTPPVVNFELWNWAAEPAPTAGEQTADVPARARQAPAGNFHVAASHPRDVGNAIESSPAPRDELASNSNGEARPAAVPAAEKSAGARFSIAAAWIASPRPRRPPLRPMLLPSPVPRAHPSTARSRSRNSDRKSGSPLRMSFMPGNGHFAVRKRPGRAPGTSRSGWPSRLI